MFARQSASKENNSVSKTQVTQVPLGVLQPVSLNARCRPRSMQKKNKSFSKESRSPPMATKSKVSLKRTPRLANHKRHLSGIKPRKKVLSTPSPIPANSKAKRQLDFSSPTTFHNDWERVVCNLAERLMPDIDDLQSEKSANNSPSKFASTGSGTVIIHGLRPNRYDHENHNVAFSSHSQRW
ncbi:hypothetical protein CAPTEDRAFT_225286 [Capitella teleta]|uniref:Uncharacterized protein n=1 Tax=Capitella teleta TaxID=283909 RepID=R7TXX0_CAPTE|nr:hypothetical protein CAPTEDRAFT_225286 [Capitella teleta]|eukprot:ELT98467.1 hypothetical protein CAPTEDRAFT_225286 [Capitella teleta]